jgi:hypothetical protein
MSQSLTRRTLLAGSGALLLSQASANPGGLTLKEAFLGRTYGKGVFRVPIAGIERRFDAVLDGTYRSDTLRVREDFFFEDGEKDRLTWVFRKRAPGLWEGVREDTVGVASVEETPEGIRLAYTADVRSRGQVTRLGFSDIIYRASPELIINEARVSWYGLPIGDVRFELRRKRI